MKILFITHLLPYPPNCGGYIRTYNFIRCLSRNHKVDLIAYLYNLQDQNQVKFLEKICNEIRVIPLQRKPLFPYLLMSFFNEKPYLYLRDYSDNMKKLVHKMIETNHYDIVFVEQLPMVGYVPKENHSYQIYANILISGMIMERLIKYQKNPVKRIVGNIETKKLNKLEKNACENHNLTITISENDKQVLESWDLSSDNIVTIPMGVDLDQYKPLKLNYNSRNIILLGLARFLPNIDGIIYFCQKIYPKVKKACPDAHLYIVGSEPPKKVRNLGVDGEISVTGFVEDLESFLTNTGVFVVPLRVGGGVKVRTLNALAMGLPTVSTSVGIEGIDVTHGKNVLIANTPDSFAKAVIDVLTNIELKKTLCEYGPLLIKEKYTWDIVFNQINYVINSIEKEKFGVN